MVHICRSIEISPQAIFSMTRCMSEPSMFRETERQFGRTSTLAILLPGCGRCCCEANPGVPQGRLAEAVKLDRSTMVGVVDSLEERGLIERRRGTDRRTNGLWLTRSGRALATRLRRRTERHEDRVAARLTGTERAQLLALLEKLGQ